MEFKGRHVEFTGTLSFLEGETFHTIRPELLLQAEFAIRTILTQLDGQLATVEYRERQKLRKAA